MLFFFCSNIFLIFAGSTIFGLSLSCTNWRAAKRTHFCPKKIEHIAAREGKLENIAIDYEKSIFSHSQLDYFYVSPTGVIVAKLKDDGAMLTLIPQLLSNQVKWKCVGAPSKDMPQQCLNTASQK
ncbi:hypothetical protein V8J88_05210 [Massilia sp. W12]|uniref:hypothetical protein n=1 Tax=Massilia sp. W12 TaxID=3126507 RepID=UPI0030CDFEEF